MGPVTNGTAGGVAIHSRRCKPRTTPKPRDLQFVKFPQSTGNYYEIAFGVGSLGALLRGSERGERGLAVKFQELEIDRHMDPNHDLFLDLTPDFKGMPFQKRQDTSAFRNMGRMSKPQLDAWRAAYGPKDKAFPGTRRRSATENATSFPLGLIPRSLLRL